MARYQEPFEDTIDLYEKYIEAAGLTNFINITILTNNSAKDIYKVTKANELLKFRTGDDIIVIINENILDRLDDKDKEMVIEESISCIHYNTEKDKVEISRPDVVTYSGILSKHGFEKWNRVREIIRLAFESERQTNEESDE
jgi:hypothetical protein